MKGSPMLEPSEAAVDSTRQATVEKVTGRTSQKRLDSLAIEEPLEIQLTYGPSSSRQTRSIFGARTISLCAIALPDRRSDRGHR
jgi:hypothetical protein